MAVAQKNTATANAETTKKKAGGGRKPGTKNGPSLDMSTNEHWAALVSAVQSSSNLPQVVEKLRANPLFKESVENGSLKPSAVQSRITWLRGEYKKAGKTLRGFARGKGGARPSTETLLGFLGED